MNIVRQKLLEWKKLIEEDYESTSNPSGDQRDLVRCCSYPYPLKFNYEFESMVRFPFHFICHLLSFLHVILISVENTAGHSALRSKVKNVCIISQY